MSELDKMDLQGTASQADNVPGMSEETLTAQDDRRILRIIDLRLATTRTGGRDLSNDG
jgi:hypothetical protein